MHKMLLILLFCSGLAVAEVSHAEPVNINTASAEEIEHKLRGIGPNRAARIVDYRQRHGPFVSAEDLMAVPYIGRRLFEANRADIRVRDEG